MHCIGCGVTLSGGQEVYCESCRRLSGAGRPLPPASHPVASGAPDIVVCLYCGERNRLVPGRVRPRCGKCNTQLPSVESSARDLATKSSPKRVLPPPEWREASELGSRVASRELPPKRVLPPPELAKPRSVGQQTTKPRMAPWARNGVVWLTVTLAGQAVLAATFLLLVALVGRVEVDPFFGSLASLWSFCAVPTAISILSWLAAVHLFPLLEHHWALFVPAWLSWVILITAVTLPLVVGERAHTGMVAWGLLLALFALLPRVSMQRLGLGTILGPSGE